MEKSDSRTIEDVSIVIVNWNTNEDLKQLLETLVSSDSNKIKEIIIVDNNSDLDPRHFIDRKLNSLPGSISKKIKFIRNEVNRGYSFACNQGVLQCSGEWILFLNPDTELSSSDVIDIARFASDKNLDAVSPEPQSNSYKKPLPSPFTLFLEFSGIEKIIPQKLSQALFKKSTLFGGALCIKRSVILELGGWDERFFVWFEDSDLTMRLYKNKFKVGWAPIPIKHKGGSSFKNMSTQLQRSLFFNSMYVLADKHFNFIGRLVIRIIRSVHRQTDFIPELQNGTSITIPNMRRRLLDRFLEENYEAYKSVEHLIIISSAIRSDELWTLRKKYPTVRFITIQHNNGFAHTVNIGFRTSPTHWVGTVNDDTVIHTKWVVDVIKKTPRDTGSVNPVIYKNDGSIESSGVDILPIGKARPIAQKQNAEFAKVPITNAASVLYLHEALSKTGLFDERFGSYLEDIDLSLRIQRAGYKNYVFTNSKVVHYGQSTSIESSNKKLLDAKNWYLVIIKNWPANILIQHFPGILTERLRNISGILKQ